MAFYDSAADFIKKYEGFTPTAMWDVNAYRIGHGSDTLTLPDNTFRKVVKGDTTTKDLAAKDLARRIKLDFEPKIKKQIGEPYYSNLPEPARIALLSLAYNYGSITKKAIIDAARTGDVVKLSDAIIESTKNDNKGKSYYNALLNRRKKEADLAKSLIQKISETITAGKEVIKKSPIKTIIVFAIIGIASFFLYKNLKK